MKKENINTDSAPGAIGPYVQAVQVGNLIYTAGQGGLDPKTGKLVSGGVQAQADQTMKNLLNVLEAAGTDFDHVIKTNIYLRYIKDFDEVNVVYASFFQGEYPARTTMAVSALPMAALVEIEMIAIVIDTQENNQAPKEIEGVKDKKEPKKEKSSDSKKSKKNTKRAKKKKRKGKK